MVIEISTVTLIGEHSTYYPKDDTCGSVSCMNTYTEIRKVYGFDLLSIKLFCMHVQSMRTTQSHAVSFSIIYIMHDQTCFWVKLRKNTQDPRHSMYIFCTLLIHTFT